MTRCKTSILDSTALTLKAYAKSNKLSLSKAIAKLVDQGLGLNRDNDFADLESRVEALEKWKVKVEQTGQSY